MTTKFTLKKIEPIYYYFRIVADSVNIMQQYHLYSNKQTIKQTNSDTYYAIGYNNCATVNQKNTLEGL